MASVSQKITDMRFLTRVLVMFNIYVCSVLVCLALAKPMTRRLFPDDAEDANFDDLGDDADEGLVARRKKINNLTMAFAAVLATVMAGISCVIAAGVALLDNTAAPDGITKIQWLFNKMKFFFLGRKEGEQIQLYWFYLFFVLVVMNVFYLIYTRIYSGYYRSIQFERVHNSTKDVEDKPQPLKYIYQYCVYILGLMGFALMLMNFRFVAEDKVLTTMYNGSVVVLLTALSVTLVRFSLQKYRARSYIFFIIFQLVFLLYTLPMEYIAKLDAAIVLGSGKAPVAAAT
jgi:hypothetical protein